MVRWLKQTKKKASELERGTTYANSNETSKREAAGTISRGDNQQLVDATSDPGQRVTSKPAQQACGQAVKPLGINKGGKA